jgi:hypothetical protein
MTFLLLPFVQGRSKKAEQHVKQAAPAEIRAGNGKRIPDTLKAVFLASNAGKDVEVIKPPPAGVAYKMFANVVKSFKQTTNSMSMSARKKHADGRWSRRTSPSSNVTCADTECDGTDNHESDNEVGLQALEALIPTMAPQDYLNTMIRTRGYSTMYYETLKTGYYNKPTALQQASYDARLIELVRQRDVSTLQSLVQCGISLNPCNQHGESLIHTICRLGDLEILQLWVQAGATLQVADDYGRTPLHDACWTVTPNFALIEYILKHDRHLLHMKDARGTTPLAYVRHESWGLWVEFLVNKRDVFWPQRSQSEEELPLPLALKEPNSRPVSNPSNALTPRLATMVVSGKVTMEELRFLRNDILLDDDGEIVLETASTVCSSSHIGSDFGESDSDFDSDSDDDSDYSDSDSSSDFEIMEGDESICQYAQGQQANQFMSHKMQATPTTVEEGDEDDDDEEEDVDDEEGSDEEDGEDDGDNDDEDSVAKLEQVVGTDIIFTQAQI